MKVGVIGLGYVGLALFEQIYNRLVKNGNYKSTDVIGVDIDPNKVSSLIKKYPGSIFQYIEAVQDCDIFFVAVPTPVNENNKPDIQNLYDVYRQIVDVCVSDTFRNRYIVIESSVAPGTVEMFANKLDTMRKNDPKYDRFILFHSPERMSPGVTDITYETKVFGCVDEFSNAIHFLERFYHDAGFKTHIVENAKTAEYVKMLENVQRDVNIALMNEFKMMCDKDNVDIEDVINAASTKSTFMTFRPGLVGGHCIGVDTWYMIDHAKQIHADYTMMQESRTVNEKYISYIAEEAIKKVRKKKYKHIVILGMTYKKDTDDMRTSGSVKLYKILSSLKTKDDEVDIICYDPYVAEYNKPIKQIMLDDTLYIVATYHSQFKSLLDDIYGDTQEIMFCMK